MGNGDAYMALRAEQSAVLAHSGASSRAPLGQNLHNVSTPSSFPPPLYKTETEETAPQGRTPNLRRQLYRLLESYREHAEQERVAKCSRVRCESVVELNVAQRDKPRAQFGGLIKCRSKACPVCLAARRSQYAEQVIGVAKRWTELHGTPSTATYLATFTIRHGWQDSLVETGHGVRRCWRKFLSGRLWQSLRLRWGLEYVCAEELTHGANGWHPHLHVLFLPTKRLSESDVLKIASAFFERWADIVERELGPQYVPSDVHGTDFRPCATADYITKAIGLELADPGTKRGKRGGRSPMRLLADWAENKDRHALALYCEYARAMRGRRDLTWSRGLRDLRQDVCTSLKETDKEVVREHVAAVPADVWDEWRNKPEAHTRILEAAESEGLPGVVRVVAREMGAGAARAVELQSRKRAEQRASANKLATLEELPESTAGPPLSALLSAPFDAVLSAQFPAW